MEWSLDVCEARTVCRFVRGSGRDGRCILEHCVHDAAVEFMLQICLAKLLFFDVNDPASLGAQGSLVPIRVSEEQD